jgi:hypothetical protein
MAGAKLVSRRMRMNAGEINWTAVGILSSAALTVLSAIWWELRFLRKAITGVIADLAHEKERRTEERGVDLKEVAVLRTLLELRPCMKGKCDDIE